jgi:hypothetical protein
MFREQKVLEEVELLQWRDPACQLLAPIYGWFTEGFYTAARAEAAPLAMTSERTIHL